MVIANSDSTNTLVSVNGNSKSLQRASSLPHGLQVLGDGSTQELLFRSTELYLPEDTFSFDDAEQSVFLAADPSRISADECLGCLPQILNARDELMSRKLVTFTGESVERVLYVGQGEVAHAVPQQCDVMMSDRATTCHILALRSTSAGAAAHHLPLVSVAHLDGPSYDECVRAMILRHKDHHQSNFCDLSIHIVGGFLDNNGSSKSISNWLIYLLADLAHEHRSWLRMTIRDSCITSINESGRSSPIARGLAMDLQTGRVFLAKCCEQVAGPDLHLRSARLWSRSSNKGPRLSLIHHQHDTFVGIEPFFYKPFPGIDTLLAYPDQVMLQHCSTSPDCEEDDFCAAVRSTLQLVRNVPYYRTFGKRCNQERWYKRVGNTNTWKLVVTAGNTSSNSCLANPFKNLSF